MKRDFDAKIRKVGNSHVVTVPSNIVKKYNLKQGKFLTVNIKHEQNIKRQFDAKVRKVGNSYVVTIPSNIVKRYNLGEGKFLTVNIEYEGDRN